MSISLQIYWSPYKKLLYLNKIFTTFIARLPPTTIWNTKNSICCINICWTKNKWRCTSNRLSLIWLLHINQKIMIIYLVFSNSEENDFTFKAYNCWVPLTGILYQHTHSKAKLKLKLKSHHQLYFHHRVVTGILQEEPFAYFYDFCTIAQLNQ